jgi:hypothetical protein
MLSTIKHFFTGGSKAVETLADGLVKGADALILTEEERLNYNKQAGELWLEVQRVTANENTERSRSRRYLAIMIMGSGLLTFWAVLIAGYWQQDFKEYALDIVDHFYIGEMMFGVSVFFFGNQLLGRFNERKQLEKK